MEQNEQAQLIKALEAKVKELEKQLDEKAPEAIYSINIDRLTIRARPGEPLDRFFFRVDAAIAQAQTRGLVKTEQPQSAPLPARDETLTQAPTEQELAPVNGGKQVNAMSISKAAIVSDRNGLPQLELYQNGHRFPDLRYSLGKDEVTRKSNLAKMLGTMPQGVTIGWEQNVSWVANWTEGRDPKYKDLVSIAK